MPIQSLHYLMLESITYPAVVSQAIGATTTLRERLEIPVSYWGLRRPTEKDALLAQELGNHLQEHGIQSKFYINWRERSKLKMLWTMAKVLWELVSALRNSKGPHIIFARNFFSQSIAYIATRLLPTAYYVADVQGHTMAEMELAGVLRRGTILWDFLQWWEKILFQNAYSVICVSSKLAEYVQSRCKKPIRCYVIPSCLDKWSMDTTKPEEIARTEDKIAGRFVVVYSGTITAWNRVEPLINLFLRIKLYQPSAFFLFLTTHSETAHSCFQVNNISESDYLVLNVPHQVISHFLALGDIGLLLRDLNEVNYVASPVKFAEYLAAGLPVIITEGVGDCSEVVRREHVGLVLESPDPDTWDDIALANFLQDVSVRREEYRNQAKTVAQRYYLRENYLEVYREALKLDKV